MTQRAATALAVAATLGLAHALVSLAWLLGSTWLLDTVGEPFVTWGTERTPALLAALAVVVVAKVAAVGVVVLGVRQGRLRALAYLAGGALLAYGTLMTVGNGLVALDVVPAAATADLYAIRWHALFWDPSFALWGATSLVALRLSRPRPPVPQPQP